MPTWSREGASGNRVTAATSALETRRATENPRCRRGGLRAVSGALAVLALVALVHPSVAAGAPPRGRTARWPGARVPRPLFSSKRVGRRVRRAYPGLVRRLQREARAWGRRGTRFQSPLSNRVVQRDSRLARIADQQGMLDEIIDVRSPKTVRVYRGLCEVSRAGFDPNYNLGRGRADCVAGHWSTALEYARDRGRPGLLVEYELPAKLLSYNRGEYIIDLNKLRANGVTSLAPFVKRVGGVGANT